MNAPAPTRWLARRARGDLVELREEDGPRLPLLRAMRPHQWAKNALVVVPPLAAHLSPAPALLLQLFLGFVAFSALALRV